MILNNHIKTTKSLLVVFCLSFIVSACNTSISPTIEVIYASDKAIAITFSSKLVTNNTKVFLEDNLETPILGSVLLKGNQYRFEPIIPFTQGKTYVLYENDVKISNFNIKINESAQAPELIAIYPSADVVPENLLKMYFKFSKPMQEVGNALDFINIIDNNTGKEVDVFLELNTELWNTEHTLLTLWLDPGRIKTDLIPNKELGLPIVKGNSYTLKIDANWKDAEGIQLIQAYEKVFNVVSRDSKKPVIDDWKVLVTPNVLTLHFNEPMDGILGRETFNIKNNSEGNYISGKYELINKEQTLKFNPDTPFTKGKYTLIVESKLEDLAGNNMNHPFDNDLTISENQKPTETKSLQFVVE